jgi:hypothetical protein
MTCKFFFTASAIALLSSGTAYASPAGGNTASIEQSTTSNHTEALIDQSQSAAPSSAQIIQDAQGSSLAPASVKIFQGLNSANTATNAAVVEQHAVLGAGVILNQSGTAGGVNNAFVKQSAASGQLTITQISNGSGDNEIGYVFFGNASNGLTQGFGTESASVNQKTNGATNVINDVYQSYSGFLTINQGLTSGSGGVNTLNHLGVYGNNTNITQNSADFGSNTINNLQDHTNSLNITQDASGTGSNTVGGGASGFVAQGGDITISQTSTGAIYNADTYGVYQGSLTINQLSASVGTGNILVGDFEGGAAVINQVAASNGGVNSIHVDIVMDSVGKLAIAQRGGDNTILYNSNGSWLANNNTNDDGATYFGSAGIVGTRTSIEQDGTFNTANLTMNRQNSVAHIYQAGDSNVATVYQYALDGNAAYIVQQGTNGTAVIYQ